MQIPLSLRVVGIFHTGSPLDESMTYTSLDTAQQFYDVPDVVNGISVRLSDFKGIGKSQPRSRKPVIGQGAGQKQILQSSVPLLSKATSNNVIYGLIIVIASFGVVSTLNLSVISATGQIGMLRAMGAPVSSIQRIFILQSGILGLLGALVRYFCRSPYSPGNRPV